MLAKEYIEHNSVPVTESGCWIWLLSCNENGYGLANQRRYKRSAHRVSYEAFKSKIPAGMNVCHKCDTPSCVNPDHLFVGTQKENMIDCSRKGRIGNQLSKTHCPHGHEFTESNTKIIRGNHRVCITCARERSKAGMRKLRGSRNGV